MTTRRDFLKAGTVLGGALLGRGATAFADAAARLSVEPAWAPIDLLVLGGTGFIGPHLVRHAVKRGHRVTIFTRGRRQADLPNEVVRLVGDRNGQLGALDGKRWDAVVDDSATNPDWVHQSAQLLKNATGRYLFTSSTGVYYAAGPKEGLTMPAFLEQAKAAIASDAKFTRVDDYAFLAAHQIDEAIPWARLEGNDDGMMSIRNDKAVASGLTFRPLATTVR